MSYFHFIFSLFIVLFSAFCETWGLHGII